MIISDSKYLTKLNAILLDRIMLVEMMQENENDIRENKTKIRTAYHDHQNQKIKDSHNQYGISCSDAVANLTEENEILIKRVNDIKIVIQSLKKDSKIYNKNKSKKDYYLSAFMAAAEILMNEDDFIEIENKALKLMQINS